MKDNMMGSDKDKAGLDVRWWLFSSSKPWRKLISGSVHVGVREGGTGMKSSQQGFESWLPYWSDSFDTSNQDLFTIPKKPGHFLPARHCDSLAISICTEVELSRNMVHKIQMPARHCDSLAISICTEVELSRNMVHKIQRKTTAISKNGSPLMPWLSCCLDTILSIVISPVIFCL